MSKQIVNARLPQELIDRMDRLAEEHETTRSDIMERALLKGLVEEESLVNAAAHPAYGVILGLLTSDAMLKAMEALPGPPLDIDPDQIERWRKLRRKKRSQKSLAPKGRTA